MPSIPAAAEDENQTVCFGQFRVDVDAGQLVKHGIRIGLREQSFQVLMMLLKRPGQIVTRHELRQKLWRDEVFVDFEKSLNTAVARLRQALGDSADHPRFIETLPKRGYRFVAPVSTTLEPNLTSPHRARLLVLPFINLSGDPAQDYFCDAITDEVITELAAIAPDHLAVIARTTAMHYKGSHKDVGRIGRELTIDYVIEGGVRSSNDRVVINVQLIQVSDQAHVFAKKYETGLRDIFDAQTAIAQAIGARIGINLPVDSAYACRSAPRAIRRFTDDPVAYDAYIRGRSLLGSWTAEGLTKAKQFFENAIAHDEQFALAHDGLAEAYAWLGFNGFMRPKDGFSAAVFSALRAIEIDPGLAQTHALLGMLRSQLDYNWAEVDREMALALRLDPASPVVRFRYAASGLLPHGRMDEAIAEVQRALEFDPLSTWQGRLPQELRLRQLGTLEAANRFLREDYIAEFNRRFQVAPKQRGSAFVPCRSRDLERIFSLQFERSVSRDNTVSFQNLSLQIERVRWRATLAGCQVVVHQHLDGTLSLTHGPHCLGRYGVGGAPLSTKASAELSRGRGTAPFPCNPIPKINPTQSARAQL